MISEVYFYLREYLFPSGCGGCGEALYSPEDSFSGLCAGCRAFLNGALTEEKRCEICGKPLITEKQSCLSCRERGALESGRYSEFIQKQRTFFPYTGRFRTVLGAYKFGKSLGTGNFLAGFFQKAIEDLGLTCRKEAAWVPVPPRAGKIKKQGWDQIEYLARQLQKKQRLPVSRCLKRLPSRSQKELNREERAKNLKGRILCVKQPPQTAILFDDIITTGATMDACASALLDGGATQVYGVCLFYD